MEGVLSARTARTRQMTLSRSYVATEVVGSARGERGAPMCLCQATLSRPRGTNERPNDRVSSM